MKTVKVALHSENVSLVGTHPVGRLPAIADFFKSCVEEADHPADRFLARFRKMTPQERVNMLIKSGVIYPNGDLAEQYRDAWSTAVFTPVLPLL